MANDINNVITRARVDMTSLGKLSRGTYFDVCELAANGVEFCLSMSIRDAYKMRAWINRHGMKKVMRQQSQEDGTMRVCFNL